ncbi:MAG: methyl-accepting chemotaxis protein [Spirochaetes bacterium]|nr:methyl-accepting chemotaxis protein [Spirochaetota bacterium]
MSIRLKMLLAFLCIAAIILVAGVLGIIQISLLHKHSVEVGVKNAPLGDAAMEIKLTSTTAHLWIEEIMTGAEEKERITEVYTLLEEALWYCDAILKGGSNDEGTFYATDNETAIAKIEETKKHLTLSFEAAQKRYDNKFNNGNYDDSILDAQFDASFDEFIVLADEAEEALHEEMKIHTEKMNQAALIGDFILIAATVISFIIAVLIALFFSNSISKKIEKLITAAKKIEEGDLEIENLNIKSKDELGQLARSFGKMKEALSLKASLIERVANQDLTIEVQLTSEKDNLGKSLIQMKNALNQVLNQVKVSAEEVSSGSEQVASSSQNLSQGATEQASSLEEVSSSISQISSQTRQNTDNAIQANSLSKTSMENAEKGNVQMKELVDAMSQINTSSDEIKKIVKTIDDIAFQINLLALNANVEAARAGKYGKGFAVVAEEVRNLAVRSAGAVKETTLMVEESIKNIESGNKLVEMTARQLEEIVDSASKVADLVEEITSASKEQTYSLDQINDAITQIDRVTQSNTSSAEEGASAAEELASMAVQLKQMISSFQLENINVVKPAVHMKMEKQLGFQVEEKQEPQINEHRNEQKIPTVLASQQDSSVNPKDVIKLDDEEFGDF